MSHGIQRWNLFHKTDESLKQVGQCFEKITLVTYSNTFKHTTINHNSLRGFKLWSFAIELMWNLFVGHDIENSSNPVMINDVPFKEAPNESRGGKLQHERCISDSGCLALGPTETELGPNRWLRVRHLLCEHKVQIKQILWRFEGAGEKANSITNIYYVWIKILIILVQL